MSLFLMVFFSNQSFLPVPLLKFLSGKGNQKEVEDGQTVSRIFREEERNTVPRKEHVDREQRKIQVGVLQN